jgi:ERCC4-type nuclease
MALTVKIDVRERQLLENFVPPNAGVTVEAVALDVGDIHICGSNPGDTLVFERKTVADLCQSIKDGRYRDQKARLLSTHPASRVYYILEGSFTYMPSDRPVHGLKSDALRACVVNSMLRDGIGVFVTRSVGDTLSLLDDIVHRVSASPEKYFNTSGCAAVGETDLLNAHIKAKKKDNLDSRRILILQLCCVPGISVRTATMICDHFKCEHMSDFMTVLNTKDLKEVPGIGKGLSANIRHHLVKEEKSI